MRSMNNQTTALQRGTTVTIHSLRADGVCYRWWNAELEEISDSTVVVWMPVGTVVEGSSKGWIQHHHIRAYYWADRFYNLLEVYEANGKLEELYIHIASPMILRDSCLSYIDYQLDVVRQHEQRPLIVDKEEYQEAIRRYGYSDELQQQCWAATTEAYQLAEQWVPKGVTTLEQ